jgi:hypothetical protein
MHLSRGFKNLTHLKTSRPNAVHRLFTPITPPRPKNRIYAAPPGLDSLPESNGTQYLHTTIVPKRISSDVSWHVGHQMVCDACHEANFTREQLQEFHG